jgi:hypothetical protein
VTLIDQVQRALGAEGINGSVEMLMLVMRLERDTTHVSIRSAPSADEAKLAFQSDGRRFIQPVAILLRDGDNMPAELPRHRVLESSEALASVGDEAYLWRGYAQNTRGVVKFRSGRYVVEVNAPSVDDAIGSARGLSALLAS